MKILHQYILRQFLFYLAGAVLFFSIVLIAGNVMKSMMDFLAEGKLSLGNCFFLMVMLVPSMVSHALPFGFVVATLLTLGEISANNEFIALRSLGIGPLKIFSSILFLASCGVFVSLVINFHYAPRAISNVKSKLQNIIREEPLRFLVPQKFIRDFPGYIIFVKNLEHKHLNHFHIWELDEREHVGMYIQAKKGTLEYDEQRNAFVLTLFQGTIEKRLEQGKIAPLVSFEKFSLDLPLDNILKGVRTHKKIRHMTLREMLTLYRQSVKECDWQKCMEIRVEIQMKSAMAFAILALVLVTIPLSVKLSRRETSINVAIALLLCLGYYAMMMILSFLKTRPDIYPDLLLWIPNVFLQVLGIGMGWKLCRH
ncbi:MAG: LptF/LptG family permease [Puniceicoccales bacterium]|nr:LptF/LptG family permease [Puniceicoccales bacterium]